MVRVLAALAVAGLGIGVVGGTAPPAVAQDVPIPECHANLTYNAIDGWDLGSDIVITAVDGTSSKTWSGDRIETWDTSFNLWLDPSEWTLRPGQHLTCSGTAATKELDVSDIAVTGWDLEANTISGTTSGVSMVSVQFGPDEAPSTAVAHPSGGTWQVDFNTADPPADLRIADQVWVEQLDADLDNTRTRVTLAPPRLLLAPLLQQVVGGDWPDGATVTLTLDNPATPASPDLTATATAGRLCTGETNCPSWMVPAVGGDNVFFDLVTLPALAHPGDTLTMSDGTTTKSLVVPLLTADAGDVATRVYRGTATPPPAGGRLTVSVGSQSEGCGTVGDVTPDAQGRWTITVDGDCELPVDATARWFSAAGDQVATSNPTTFMKVHPDTDRVWASWPGLASVTLTVARGGATVFTEDATTANVLNREHWNYDMWAQRVGDLALPQMARWDLSGRFDLQAGDILTATDGNVTRTITVDRLTVDAVSPTTDTVAGTGNQDVGLKIVNEGENGYWGYSATPDATGHWSYTFTAGTFPNPPDGLTPGMSGQAWVNDTVVRWVVPAEGTATATTITRDAPDPSVTGQSYQVTVRVARVGAGSGQPLGVVTVSDGLGGGCTAATPSKIDARTSQFTCGLRAMHAGVTALMAVFSPAAGWAGSGGGTGHTINRASTSTVIANADALGTPTRVGESYLVQVRLTAGSPGSGRPDGVVTVSDGTATCVVTSYSSSGSGACRITSTSAGRKIITARYAGSADYRPSQDSAGHRVR